MGLWQAEAGRASHLGVGVHAVDEIVHLRVVLLLVALVGLQGKQSQDKDEEGDPQQEHRQEETSVHGRQGQGLAGDHQVSALGAELARVCGWRLGTLSSQGAAPWKPCQAWVQVRAALVPELCLGPWPLAWTREGLAAS